MTSVPGSHAQPPPPRQRLNIHQRPSSSKRQSAEPPKPPSRSSSFSFSNRTSSSSINSGFHAPRGSPRRSKSRSRSNSGGGDTGHYTRPGTPADKREPQEELTFTCTFCWRPYPSSERRTFHTTPTTTSSTTSGRKRRGTRTPRLACTPCYRAIIDLSIYWVCGEVVLRGDECDEQAESQGEKKGRGVERLGRERGREIDQVPLCRECLVEVEEKGPGDGEEKKEDVEMEVVKKGLERIDKVDGGLTRRRWELREDEKAKEKEVVEEKTGDSGIKDRRRGAVDDRSGTENRNEIPSSSASDKPETIYVNIFDPVGREAFRPSLTKPIPEWMQSGAREELDRKVGPSSAVKSVQDKPRKQMTKNNLTNSTPRPISQESLRPGISESSSTATVIQTPQPSPSRTPARRRSGAISPRAMSPVPSITAISRPSSVLGRQTPYLRTGTSFVSEQPLVVPSMSATHSKETTTGPTEDPSRDSWLSRNSNLSSSPPTAPQPELSSRPSSVRSFATLFERGIATKDQRHTPVNQPLPLLRVLQQPYRPPTPTRSDMSVPSSQILQPDNLAPRPQRAQTRELGAASLPKPIQTLRSGQAGQSSVSRISATVSIPVVSTSTEYLERYQPVKASTSFLSSSIPPQSARTSVRTSVRKTASGLSTIARGWEGQLSSNTSSSRETKRDLSSNRLSAVYSTSQPPASYLQSSYQAESDRRSIRRSASHVMRREGAHDEGVAQSSQPDQFSNVNGRTTIRRSISHSVRRERAHDHDQGQSNQSMSQTQSPKPRSPTVAARIQQYTPISSPPSNSPPYSSNSSNGPTSPAPLNFTVQRSFVKGKFSKGGPTVGPVVTSPSTPTTTTGWSSELSPTAGTGTGEEKNRSGSRPAWSRTRTPSTANTMDGASSGHFMPPPVSNGGKVKALSRRRSVQAEMKRFFGRQ